MTAEGGTPVIPYVPFRTFLAAIEAFERGLPPRIDRSLWPTYSGAIQGQLLNAFRFLGLLSAGDEPSADLRALVEQRENRRALVAEIFRRAYADILRSIDLARCSPKQLDDAMRAYGLSGATHRKAVSFFLHGARYAGLPLSELLRRKTRTAAFGRRKHAEAPPAAAQPERASELSKTIALSSGGALTLHASVDLFSLSPEDRQFLFDIIDRLQAYPGRH